MKKTKVVVASLLKPIDDTRMFEKFGLSMAETNKYDINIIGFDSKNITSTHGITFHPTEPFDRVSLKRILQHWKTFKKLLKLKPEVVIVNTHELLFAATFSKILTGSKFIYDIRENYAKNIKETNVFPWIARAPLAAWVRLKEWINKPFVDQFILAERIYEQQLPFLSKHTVIIENKYAPQNEESTAQRNTDPSQIDLLFSGTISESNGVFDAIDITKSLHLCDPKVRLKIVGYCALKRDLVRLQQEIEAHDFIELIGGDFLVPHTKIVEAIQKADFGFVLKKPNNGMNDEKILTRLFEYTANKLPMLLLNNPKWVEFCNQFNAAIQVDPEDFHAKTLLDAMKNTDFYTKGNTENSLWATEKPKLLEVLEKHS